MPERQTESDPYLIVIARALGYLCLEAAELKDAPLAHSLEFLERLGFNRGDCASILDTTTECIRVTLTRAGKKKHGREPRKSQSRANGKRRAA